MSRAKEEVLVSDTADVTITRNSDGHRVIYTQTQMASIEQSLGIDDKVYGGIGFKPIAIVKGQKEVTTTFRNALYDANILAMTQGVAVEKGTATINELVKEVPVENGTVSIDDDIAEDSSVHLLNARGNTIEVEYDELDGIVVPEDFALDGDLVSVNFEKDITGDIVEIESDKFGESYSIEYHTIGKDPMTQRVVKDYYIQLDNVVPSGEMELSFEGGEPIAPEITFEALTAPNSNRIGRLIQRHREE